MSNRTIKLIPYSKEKFPQTKTINEVPIEEATKNPWLKIELDKYY